MVHNLIDSEETVRIKTMIRSMMMGIDLPKQLKSPKFCSMLDCFHEKRRCNYSENNRV